MKSNEKHMDSNEVLFCEHYAAAQSLKSAWTRLASTYGCLMIVLSRKTLIIKPHWFAKWFICLLHLDLCHEIPTASISRVMERGKGSSYGKVELHFQTVEGKAQKIVLYLKNYREFINQATRAIHREPHFKTSDCRTPLARGL
jgi:hypothetical protein